MRTQGRAAPVKSYSIGKICCAQYTKDDHWYRGLITGGYLYYIIVPEIFFPLRFNST